MEKAVNQKKNIWFQIKNYLCHVIVDFKAICDLCKVTRVINLSKHGFGLTKKNNHIYLLVQQSIKYR